MLNKILNFFGSKEKWHSHESMPTCSEVLVQNEKGEIRKAIAKKIHVPGKAHRLCYGKDAKYPITIKAKKWKHINE
jgi:hypothetical protein